MKDLIQSTINKIKKEHIAPEPRWKFLLQKIGVWLSVGILIVLGAAIISVSYFLLTQLDWDLYRFMHKNVLLYALSIMPYFWLILLSLFVIMIFFRIRKIEYGYRFNSFLIIFVAVGMVLFLGSLMSLVGVGNNFNNMMMYNVPFYAQNIETREKQWMQPDRGFLAGTIQDISGKVLKIDDLSGNQWEIQLDEKTLVRPAADIASGKMIKIIGKVQAKKVFLATEIRPWVGIGMMSANGKSETCGMETIGACGNHGGMMDR